MKKLAATMHGVLLILLIVVGVSAALAWLLWGRRADPGSLDQGQNGLWMRRFWLHGGQDTDEQALVSSLAQLGITRIYPFLGPMDVDGTPGWRKQGTIQRYDPAVAGRFLQAMEQQAPGIAVLPWTGGLLDRDVRLQDEQQRAAFAEHMAALVAMGAEGVQLNVEPLPSFEPGYLELLGEVKRAIGPEATLSIAGYPPRTPLHQAQTVHWTLEFTREVCLAADELAFMAYDTGLGLAWLYEVQVAIWARQLARTLPPPGQGGCTWSLGMPAYEDDVAWHDPQVESLEHGLRGVLRGFAGREAPDNFHGITLYASWTTDEAEWASYDRVWRGREPRPVQPPDRDP